MKPKAIYTLTLDDDESTKRLQEFVERLPCSVSEAAPMHVHYGLNGRVEQVPSNWTRGRWDGDLTHLKGSKAVCYSHLSMILGAIGQCPNEDDFVMILEDDVSIHENVFEYLSEIEIPDDWDFIHLSYWDIKCGSANQGSTTKGISKITKPCCTGMFSYLVKPRKVFQRLIDAFPLTCEIDNFLSNPENLKLFNIYVIEHTPWLTDHVSEFSIRDDADNETWKLANP